MQTNPNSDNPAEQAFRRLFCWVFCKCTQPAQPRPQWRIKDLRTGQEITFRGEFMDFKCDIDAGPFSLNVDKFVDDAGNTTTDADIPVWTSSDPTVVALAADPANPQGQTATLTKKSGATVLSAAFGDQTKIGTPGNYLLNSTLTVNPGVAVAGSIEVAGPGVSPA